MKEREFVRVLQQDVVIPGIVQEAANAAFSQIRGQKKKTKWKKRWAAGVVIAILAGSAVTVGAAAAFHWSTLFERDMKISEEQKTVLQEGDVVDFIGQSVTNNGITVTAQQSAADEQYAYVTFLVEGVDFPDESETADFEGVSVSVAGGGADLSTSMELLDEDDAKSGMAYALMVNNRNLIPGIAGKDITVSFQSIVLRNPESGGKIVKTIDGPWTFAWTLKGADQIVHTDCEEPVSDGLTITGVDLSPVSVRMTYEIPDTAGAKVPADPLFWGVQMKDGTVYPCGGMGNSAADFPDASQRFQSVFLGRIVDPSQVQALLFEKRPGIYEEDADISGDRFYIIPLK